MFSGIHTDKQNVSIASKRRLVLVTSGGNVITGIEEDKKRKEMTLPVLSNRPNETYMSDVSISQ